MTAFRGPGVRQIGAVGTTPKEHRLALAGQYWENAPGVPRSGLLVQGAVNVVTATAATGTLTYSVAPAPAVIGRTAAEGVYTPTSTGATTVNTGAAPASGSRYDLIWVKQNDQEKGDADNAAVFGVTQGTSGATPARPTGSVPAGALVIAEARIFSGTLSTTASPNTMTQVFPITAARGGVLPVRTITERATITTPAPGAVVSRLDLPGNPLEVWDGSTWKALPRLDLGHPPNVQPIEKKGNIGLTTGTFGDFTITLPEAFPTAIIYAEVHDASPITNNDWPLVIKWRLDQSDRTKIVGRCYRANTGAAVASSTFILAWSAAGW